LPLRTVEPDAKAAAVYEQLYRHYRDVYFALGSRDAKPVALGKVLPELRKIAAAVQKAD
jgi:L-ribulokinase